MPSPKRTQTSEWRCRWAPSLGELAGTAKEAWGTLAYDPAKDQGRPLVAFGLYGLPDFYALWRHQGRKAIFWAGSDIRHLRSGYWLDEEGEIKMNEYEQRDRGIAEWINEHCENWVENEGEAWQLKDCGIEVTGIVPSFLGDVRKYPISFKRGNRVYLSSNEGSQREYGWGIVTQIADSLPQIEFHLYGAEFEHQPLQNVIVHGRVPQETMDRETRRMQCGLRLNKHDGFSEITAKSILWGQYPITYLYFPMVDQYTADQCGQSFCLKSVSRLVKMLRRIPKLRQPNLKARAYYLLRVNQFPWNVYAKNYDPAH